MDFSIVVPTHRRLKELKRLLKSLVLLSESEYSFETIVVANEKTDPVLKTDFSNLKDLLNLRVVCSGKVGVNCARNKGLSFSQGEIVWFLDDDCLLNHGNYLKQFQQLHQQFPKALAIGGGYELPEAASRIERAYNIVSRSWQAPAHQGDHASGQLVGGNVSYKRQSLQATGERFNESIVFGGAESEFHSRLSEQGHEVLYFEFLNVVHSCDLSENQFVAKAIAQGRTHGRYAVVRDSSARDSQAYHLESSLMAKKKCRSQKEFEEVLSFIDLYNKAFRLAASDPEASDPVLMKSMKHWKRSNSLRARL